MVRKLCQTWFRLSGMLPTEKADYFSGVRASPEESIAFGEQLKLIFPWHLLGWTSERNRHTSELRLGRLRLTTRSPRLITLIRRPLSIKATTMPCELLEPAHGIRGGTSCWVLEWPFQGFLKQTRTGDNVMYNLKFKLSLILEHFYLPINPAGLDINYNAAIYSKIY